MMETAVDPASDAMSPAPIFDSCVRLGDWLAGLRGWRRNLLLLFVGVLATGSLAPFHAWILLTVGFVPFFWCGMTAARPRRSFADGWWFGFGFFTSGLYWFAYALLVDASRFGWLIPFAVFGLSALFALYTGLTGLGYYAARGLRRAAWPVYAASLWAVTEWIRGYLFTGFPWNGIGYVFTASNAMMQPAAFIGSQGLGWLAVFLAVLPACFLAPMRNRAQGWRYAALFFTAVIFIAALYAGGTWRLMRHPTRYVEGADFRLVQAAIQQYQKGDPNERLQAVQKHAKLALGPGYDKIRYLVWSETSMTFPFTDQDDWAKRLGELVPDKGLLFTGVVRILGAPNSAEQPLRLYNGLQTVDQNGHLVFSYDKRKLVPFGEFVPLRHILPIDKITPGALDFSTGPGPGHLDLPHGDGAIFPLICYEAIFPELSEGAWPAAILNITNDAWFGDSTGPYQHLAMSRMRAVEQGVPVLRDANSGISAFIDPYGRLLKFLPLDEIGVLDSPLPKSTEQPTFYALFGAQTLVWILMASFLWCFGCLRKDGVAGYSCALPKGGE